MRVPFVRCLHGRLNTEGSAVARHRSRRLWCLDAGCSLGWGSRLWLLGHSGGSLSVERLRLRLRLRLVRFRTWHLLLRYLSRLRLCLRWAGLGVVLLDLLGRVFRRLNSSVYRRSDSLGIL